MNFYTAPFFFPFMASSLPSYLPPFLPLPSFIKASFYALSLVRPSTTSSSSPLLLHCTIHLSPYPSVHPSHHTFISVFKGKIIKKTTPPKILLFGNHVFLPFLSFSFYPCPLHQLQSRYRLRAIESVWPSDTSGESGKVKTMEDSLSVVDDLVLMNARLYIPRELRGRVLKKLHTGHQGVVRTTMKARESGGGPRNCQRCKKRITCGLSLVMKKKESLEL